MISQFPPQPMLPPQPPPQADPIPIAIQEMPNERARHIGQKIRFAVLATVLFFVLSNPVTYRFTNEIVAFFFGSDAATLVHNETCVPMPKGLILHSIIFLGGILFLFTSSQL